MTSEWQTPAGEAAVGWIADDVAAEFPELGLRFLEVPAVGGRSPQSIRDRLAFLSNRFRGAQAVTMRQDPIPWAYRVFYRHIGLDPDEQRTPLEALAVRRLLEGAFRSQGLLEDARTLALLETGVPIWAVDAAHRTGALGIRPAEPGELLGRTARGTTGLPKLPRGRLVVADSVRPLAVLFGDLGAGLEVSSGSERMVLFSVQVAGVPELHVEEALWNCLEVLAEAVR
ncbi:MAG: hypothetical protein ACR2HD_08265 [Solirubrobacteraceae bacterium]|nr:MAG: hypothetical protein DLM63_05745 [Solirubrobacterales bacterium]